MRSHIVSPLLFDRCFIKLLYWRHMTNQILSKPLISFLEVVRSREPKTVFEAKLLALLTLRLKELKIVWNPKAFKGGLSNPALPEWIIRKLESIIDAAETCEWRISNMLKHELDETVEDVETFNPPFRGRLARERKTALRDFRLGRTISHNELMKRLGIKA